MYKLRIAAKGDSFRRAGVAFTREGQDFQIGELSEAQLRVLVDEPMLAITVLPADEGVPAELVDKPSKKAK